METFNARRITRIGLAAVLYIALTVSLSFISFSRIQFRISESLMLLCFFNKDYIFSMTIGCFAANIFSPMTKDIFFGTAATLLAASCIYIFRKEGSLSRMILCSLFPVISNSLIIAAELHFYMNDPYWKSAGSVAVGEFVCVTIIGVAMFNSIQGNKRLMQFIAPKKT